MSDLLRFHTPRNPEVISREYFNKIAIDSHPASFRSDRFTAWLKLCAKTDYLGLTQQFASFLKSEESVTSIDDFKEDVPALLKALLIKGKNITTEGIIQCIERAKLQNQESSIHEAITRTSDTLLAAVFLKKAGSIKGISHQDIIKLLVLVDGITNLKKESVQTNLSEYLSRPIMLPPCFFRLNPCSKKIENRETFFQIDQKSELRTALITQKKDGDCNCIPDDKCVEQNPCCATVMPYVTDLMVVREEVRCYVAGELSYIENILMGESRTRKHRHLERSEDYVEQANEISNYTEKDHQATEKFSLQKEPAETVKQDLALDAGVTYTAKYGTAEAGTSLTTNLNASYDWSKSTAQKIAQDYSKDVVDRSLTKVEEKMRKLVTQKRIIETEEKNKHVFNNTSTGIGGTENISGQYFYVNKRSLAQVFNYGKRLLCDILVPEPSELYKRLLEKQFDFKLVAPVKPAVLPQDIKSDNYLPLVLQYGVTDFEFPPETQKKVVISFKGGRGHETRKWNGYFWVWTGSGSGNDDGPKNFIIPDGYVTEKMETSFGGVDANLHGLDFSIYLILANLSLSYGTNISSVGSIVLPPLEGSQSVAASYLNMRGYSLDLIITFKLKAEALLKWQLSIYNKIMEAYEKQKKDYDDAYNKAVAEFEAAKAVKHNRNPFLNRETERIELKQMAISYISCKFYDEMNAMKNKVKPCGFPQMDLEEAEREGRWVQFFEQAFEWPLMTYLFYPYYWSRKCTWEDKMKEESDDMIFEKFLQSGFAKLQIPVRPGFEHQIQHFLAFGEIWEDNDTPPLPGDPYYVSMAQEIREERGNFNADRLGSLKFTRDTAPNVPNNTVTLTDTTAYYWNFGTPAIPATLGPPPTPAIPAIPSGLNQLNIDSDLDREIIIDCKVYRIVSIAETNPLDLSHTIWTITLDRDYEGDNFQNMKWSTGAVYIGAPWEFTTPTQLVWLRGKAKCLPCLPLKCEEPQ